MLVLGMGLGGVMQVLVIIVQNGVPHSELGVATSGATFFRSIGGSFGTAIFGAIFSNVLVSNLANHLHGLTLPAGFSLVRRDPGGARPPVGDGARGLRVRLRRVDPDGVPHRGADRPAGVPRLLADPAGGAEEWASAASAAPTAEANAAAVDAASGLDDIQAADGASGTAVAVRVARPAGRRPAVTVAGEPTRANQKPAARPARRAQPALS